MADPPALTVPAPAPAIIGGSATPGEGAQTAGAGFSLSSLLPYLKRGDIALAVGVVAILIMLLLPMPRWLLDISLAISITISVMILMTVLFIRKALEFNSFPTVLLITTLLRLSLNVASARIILAHGHEGPDAAGHVIEAFGQFIMSGNFIIGVIVFGILVIVNFVVITKGSSRIAEVAARFTLDAMPGKQMAIDADLNAGLIKEGDARARRKELEEESAFFGAMDGAAKFVRGDAIAGLIITFVNILGGIIIGTVQMGLTFGQATRSYTLLTVGDGLVTQIPALMVSIAAGFLVSKAGVSGATDKALFVQFTNYPTALGLSSVLLLLLSVLPGMPFLPFFILGMATGTLAFYLPRIKLAAAEAAKGEPEAAAPPADEPISTALAIDFIRLELGYGLLPLVSGNGNGSNKLTDQIKGLRRQLAGDMGFVLPSVRIQDNLQLPANTYVVRVKEIEAARGELRPNMLLCMDPRGAPIPLPGEATTEPTFGLPAMWIPQNYREEAHFKGLTVVDPSSVITTHITEVVKDNLAELLSYSETQKLLDELDKLHQKLIADVIPSQISLGGLQRVLQQLLAERVSIRDLPTILEGIFEASGHTRNIQAITEHVRTRLSRQLCEANVNSAGFVPLLPLSPDWEQAFAESLHGTGEEKTLSMPPSKLQQFIGAVRQKYEQFAVTGDSPVLLTSATIRPYVRSIVERFRPQTVVMSQVEVHPKARIKTLGQV
jgi:flagellar biosynthesis protein FlhA